MALTPGILSGMRVVEVSAFVAAPLGGMTLAQLGADVIRIDALQGGLDHRRWPVTENDISLFWCGLNKAKRSVAIDIAREEGRELAMAIICAQGADAGMLLTNFAPRGWLSYETLCEQRPDLIQLTIQGTWQGRSAVDYTINPSMGLPFLTGPESDERAAVNHVLPAWDLVTGHLAATGLLAAERHRRLSGKGQHVQLALEDVALASMGSLGFLAEAQLKLPRERAGNYLYGAFGRDFLCADGERVMVVGLTRKQWQSLVAATGLAAKLDDLSQYLQLDWQQEGDRFKGREAISALFEPWFSLRVLDQVKSVFDQHNVCWSRYQSVSQLVTEDPSCSAANPLFKMVDQPQVGNVLTAGIPLSFSAYDRTPPTPAPRLGEHTEEVLFDLLGITGAEFGVMHAKGLVGVTDRSD